jgi:hypothetical protein
MHSLERSTPNPAPGDPHPVLLLPIVAPPDTCPPAPDGTFCFVAEKVIGLEPLAPGAATVPLLAVAGGLTLVTPPVGAAGLPGEAPSAPLLVVLVEPNGSIGSGGLPRLGLPVPGTLSEKLSGIVTIAPGLLVGVLADPIAWP